MVRKIILTNDHFYSKKLDNSEFSLVNQNFLQKPNTLQVRKSAFLV